MKDKIISLRELADTLDDLLTTRLLPVEVAEEFVAFEKRYWQATSEPAWRIRRDYLKPQVDALVRASLACTVPQSSAALLRKAPNEVLVYYFDRILLVQQVARGFAQSNDRILLRSSVEEFWLPILLGS